MDTDLTELKAESKRLREIIINQMAEDGGHVGPPLGVIEIIQALLQVYDFSKDKITFDVGHQMHAYKLLTDRAERFSTMDKKGGIGEYSNIHESPFDFYTGGHSGLSISAALGYAINHSEYKSIALIGDGSMTGGQPYEALNQAGDLQPNLLVIYNDNEYSVTENTGVLHSKKRLKKFSESLGFEYVGVLDGHDLGGLIKILHDIKGKHYPVFLHLKTIKGRGYEPAEKDPVTFHWLGPYDVATGKLKKPEHNAFRDLVIEKVQQFKQVHENLYLVSPAAARSSGLKELKEMYPDTVFDTGMNEQHCVTFSAALALNNNKVICFIPATFLPRALDQIIDVCLQNVPLVFVLLNPGIGKTGPTHQGIYTFPILNMLPNLELLNPSSLSEFSALLEASLNKNGPVFIQKPAENIENERAAEQSDIVKLRNGNKLTVISIGNMLGKALRLADSLEGVQVLHAKRIKPLNLEQLSSYVHKTGKLLVLEDGCVHSGVGEHIVSHITKEKSLAFELLGVKDKFPQLGTIEDVYEHVGIDDATILKTARALLKK